MSALPSIFSSTRRKPLAACVAALFAVSAPAAYANSVFVTNCNDSGVGSLRAAVAAAADSDTVDMAGLTSASSGCSASKITLTTGDVVVNQNNLTIVGPGTTNLTITAKYSNGSTFHQYQNRIFTHNGTGILAVQNVSLSKGYVVGSSAVGGCILSTGSVALYKAGLYFCSAHATSGLAAGGAVYAGGNLSLKYSFVSANTADGGSSGIAIGGGLVNGGRFSAKYSTISANTAGGSSGHVTGTGGGAYIAGGGDTIIRGTTISGNTSGNVVGGIVLFGGTGTTATITNSTISGNTATAAPFGVVGGLYAVSPALNIYNSTIAFNAASTGSGVSPGVLLSAGSGVSTVKLSSTLIANNTYGSSATDYDLSVAGSVTISGQNNLIRVSSASLPGGTIVGSCPILGPLRFNGGRTQTHALFSHSPGVDQGNNTLTLAQDQRGGPFDSTPYPYPRVSNGVADIGAFELQQAEIIFDANFEGCP